MSVKPGGKRGLATVIFGDKLGEGDTYPEILERLLL